MLNNKNMLSKDNVQYIYLSKDLILRADIPRSCEFATATRKQITKLFSLFRLKSFNRPIYLYSFLLTENHSKLIDFAFFLSIIIFSGSVATGIFSIFKKSLPENLEMLNNKNMLSKDNVQYIYLSKDLILRADTPRSCEFATATRKQITKEYSLFRLKSFNTPIYLYSFLLTENHSKLIDFAFFLSIIIFSGSIATGDF